MLEVTATAPDMMELARATPQFIEGAFRSGEGMTFAVIDPSTEEVVVEMVGASVGQVGEMIASAKRAQAAWGDLPPAERIAALRRFVEALGRRADEVRDVLVAEAGLVAGAQAIVGFQVHGPLRQAGEILDLYASLPETTDNPIPLDDRVGVSGLYGSSVMRYTPIGVVAAIAAYNYPLFTAVWKVLPALVTGNAVILRPSPLTPISSLVFAQAAFETKLPAGLLSVLIEGGSRARS